MKTQEDKEYLEKLRHSTAHLLAAAVLKLWPGSHNAIGPAIENGFYQDFDMGDVKISEADLPKIEERMRTILLRWTHFEYKEVSVEEARKLFAHNPYKLELIEEFVKEGKKLLTNNPGNFLDLCKMTHVENPAKEMQHFRLLSIAGAYWRGNEKNKMLTRIYGTVWPRIEELDHYLWQQEESKKRDHRKIGKDLNLFVISEEVGPGLILWTPKGNVLREELEKLAKETESKQGYQRVATPHIAKHTLFEISGHLPYYRDDMYSPILIDGEEYFLKGMNCPHHHMIYKSQPRSYKDLPMRLTEYGMVYRHEASGTLFGLMRVRSICQNDAHIYCTMEQAEEEFLNVLKLHQYYYDIFGFSKDDYYIVMGLPSPEKKDKYHGDKKLWSLAEKIMRSAISKSGIKCVDDIGGAAFYGPKIDFNIKSVVGREFGISTNQLDLYMPTRFNLDYTDKDGSKKLCVVIHRAPLGSHERFIGFLIEHFGGAFPTWLAPAQAVVLPISDKQQQYAQKVVDRLKKSGIRVELNDKNEPLPARIRDAEMQKIPYILVVGKREAKDNSVSVRIRHSQKTQVQKLQEFIKNISQEISIRALPKKENAGYGDN